MTKNERPETKPIPKSKIKTRLWRADDISALVQVHKEVYHPEFDLNDLFDKRVFTHEFEAFPEGQFLCEVDGKIVGYACSIIVQLTSNEDAYYTYAELTGNGTFSTHDPSGDTLYGADIAVLPEFRGTGVAGKLYEQRKKLLRRYNLRRMVAHGRLPGFMRYSGKMTAEEFVEKVIAGELSDSALRAHLKAGYRVKKILLDHTSDEASLHYATWLEMLNPQFSPERRKIAATPIERPSRRIRVCATQYELRTISGWEDFENQARFFINAANTYHSHFVIFPELFTVQMFSALPDFQNRPDAMLELAKYTPRFREFFSKESQRTGVYIIAGSQPAVAEGRLHNTSFFFTPSGGIYQQEKLHITPAERSLWGFQPGDRIRVFDTPLARIAIAVCYDIEFPELIRLLVNYGAEIIFVPFSTDERKAYNRIRYCAHARAVENYVYVVISGNVGNLPNVRGCLINYSQSAVITPSDVAFSSRAVEAEADPNAETVIFAELDINTLLLQREMGSVRPHYDVRRDLYEVQHKVPVEIIKVD